MHNLFHHDDILYTGAKPWHKMGVYFENGFGVEEMKKSRLNVQVEKSKAMNVEGDHQSNQYWLRRADNKQVLSKTTVSGDYTILQNEQLMEFWSELLESHNYVLETAGILCGGQDIWIQGKKKEGHELEVIKGDPIKKYLLTHNGFDGRTSLSVRNVATRVVCNNTLMSATTESSKSAIKIYHSHGIAEALEGIKLLIIHSEESFKSLENVLLFLAKKPIKYSTLEQFFANVLKKPYRDPNELLEESMLGKRMNGAVKKCFDAYEKEAESMPSEFRGSGYHVYNAITHFWSNIEGSKNPTTQMRNNELGAKEGLRKKAIKLLVAA